jgi:hypothetical protein
MQKPLLLSLLLLAACEGALVGERPPPAPAPVLPVTPPVELPPFAPAPLRARLLLAPQYRNAVASLLGAEAAAAVTPPRDIPVNGLTAIGASQLTISASSVDAYEESAYLAAKAALAARRAALVPCAPVNAGDAACMRKVAEQHVPRAFRRPASVDELNRWTQVGLSAAEAYGAFDRGVEFLLAGLLQSPAFLYLGEVGEPDPANPARRRLTDWELASRLSFFLTNAPPDDLLWAAAAAGALQTEEALRAQARRLLQRPEARAAMTQLFDELFELQRLDSLAKDPQRFPRFVTVLGWSMREETRRTLVDAAFDAPSDLRGLFTRRTTFVDLQLAEHYGLPAVSGWQQVALPAGRAGLLTQASFLALQSHPSQNSPTHRGKFIRERLLCMPIPAPPPSVSTTLPETPPGTQRTLRQRLEVHMQSVSCSGCHQVMDPLGFAFEGFDATGRAQALDDGLPIDTSGAFDEHGAFSDAAGLAQQLHDDPRVMACLLKQVYRQGVGHVDLASEGRSLAAAEEAFAASGYRYQALLEALVVSDAFRLGAAQEVTP